MNRRRARLVATLLGATIIVAGCSPFKDEYNGRRIATPVAKPAIALARADSTPYDVVRETEGRPTLLYFGYTHCPDVCPIQLTNLAGGLRELGGDTASQVRVLIVSLDPARDTGAVFTEWVRHFHPDFIGLRAEKAQVVEEVKRLGLAPPADVLPDTATVDPAHASAVIAFTRDGLGRFIYPANTSPAAWAYDLRKMLRAQ